MSLIIRRIILDKFLYSLIYNIAYASQQIDLFMGYVKNSERHNKEEENHTEKIENFCLHMVRHTYTSLAYSAGADVKS